MCFYVKYVLTLLYQSLELFDLPIFAAITQIKNRIKYNNLKYITIQCRYTKIKNILFFKIQVKIL